MSRRTFSDNGNGIKFRKNLSVAGGRLTQNLDKDLRADKEKIERRLNKSMNSK